MTEWRVGKHYRIHVYEGDRPVATFHDPADAESAVRLHNEAAKKSPTPWATPNARPLDDVRAMFREAGDSR